MKEISKKLLAVVFCAVLSGLLPMNAFARVGAIDNDLVVVEDLAAPEDFDLSSFVVWTGATSGYPVVADTVSDVGISVFDNVPALVWQNDELSSLSRSFTIPSNYPGGLAFEVLCSTSSTSTLPIIQWALRLNIEDTAFGSNYNQEGVALTNTSSDTQNEVKTLRANSTVEAAIRAALKKGKSVMGTLTISQDTTGSGTLEVKKVRKMFHNFKD